MATRGRLNLLIQTPDHPAGVLDIHKQSGNHTFAQDGAVLTYMLAWNWFQAMPDRATGFYGLTVLEMT